MKWLNKFDKMKFATEDLPCLQWYMMGLGIGLTNGRDWLLGSLVVGLLRILIVVRAQDE